MTNRLLLLALLVFASPLASYAAKGVPVETLFKKAEFASFRVSPNGEYLGVLAPYERRLNVHVIELATMKITRLTNVTKTDIAGFQWITDDRIFFEMDNGGDEYFGLFAIDRDGSNPTTITPLLSDDASFTIPRHTTIIDKLQDDPDYVLVSNNDRRADYPDVYLLDIHTGRKKIHLSNPGNVIGWMTDQDGIVRIGSTMKVEDDDTVKMSLIYRDGPDDEFEQIVPYEEDDPKFIPLEFDHDGKTLYVAADHGENDTKAIYSFDLNSGKIGDLIYGDETYDAGGVLISEYTKKLAGYVINRDKPEYIWIDQEKAQIHEAMNNAYPGTINEPTSMSDDETVMVYTSYSSEQPAFYNLISLRGGTLKLTPLGQSRRWIEPETMSEQEPFTFEARDGETVYGYMWFPPNSDRKNLPLIVNPHGGPNARDSYGWNPEIQFFTTRGFAVLQVNYRGSTGYGAEYLKSGYKEWGGKMLEDMNDAVDWMAEQGYVDKDKVGICGASYGGYATMAQLAFYPERYKFGINYVGIVDLAELLKYDKSRSDYVFAIMQNRLGHLDNDSQLIEEQSPISKISDVQAPVFIVHGIRDPRVPVKQAEILRRAMKKNGQDFKWLVKRNEGHGFRKEENQFTLYNEMEDFIRPFMKKWGML